MADWPVLTWKASLRSCFCWFALRFREITYAKNSVFQGYLLEIFCWAKNKRNLCFAKWWSHRSVVFAASFIIHIIMQFSYCCFVSASEYRRWTGRIWVCFVVTPVRYEVGQYIFFLVYFSTSFKNQNIYLKKNRAVEAVESNRLSLRRVKIHLGRIRSKRCRSENWFFLHTLFLENEVQIKKNNYTMMLFMLKQVSLPKISSILQKIKIGPKCYIHPFCTKPFN